MSANINRSTSKTKRILMIVANPTTASTTGWPVGFWISELTHPYYEFTEVGYAVDIASPEGGKVQLDEYSDPHHESGYSASDLISMGFLNTPKLVDLLEKTQKVARVNPQDYDAIVIAGGQSPMFTFRENEDLKKAIANFYESEKIVAALCHGVASLLDVKLANHQYLIDGKTMTGFANIEEDFVDNMMGQTVMPFRIENVAKDRGANYVSAGLWRSYAVRDGSLITGQQQYSGRETAQLVIEALGI